MQPIVSDQPYRFVSPLDNRFWQELTRWTLPRQLRKTYGIHHIECVGAEKLKASFDAGRGVILAPNHCRPCDPIVIDALSRKVGHPFSPMASWHLFTGSPIQRFLIRCSGAFSIYREGQDREALKCAIGIAAAGRRALMLFPEGFVTRCNDHLLNLMDGPSFIARSAAKHRKDAKVVIHPVFVRYFFEGDLGRSITPVLESLEQRLSWKLRPQLPLRERVEQAGSALLGLKELELMGEMRKGSLYGRSQNLLEHVLRTLQDKWIGSRLGGDPMERIKQLRGAVLREMIQGKVDADERSARWRDLADLYLAQQLCCYPPDDYLDDPAPERLLEAVERMEEDLTDVARPHGPMRAIVMVDDPIEVGPERDRSAKEDPVTAVLRASLERMRIASRELRRKPSSCTA